MACLFHKWNGCRCDKCGTTRDESHLWNGCKCGKCGKTRDELHNFNGCKCISCGKKRDEQHSWDLCKGRCSVCGKTQNEQHEWNGCKCSRCGEMMGIEEIKNLTDQKALAEIAKSAISLNDAVKMYTPGKKYPEIHKLRDKRNYPCIEAVKKLTNQELLTDIAENISSPDVRIAAAKKLTDQTLAQRVYASIAKNDIDYSIGERSDAVKKITDMQLKKELETQIDNWLRNRQYDIDIRNGM